MNFYEHLTVYNSVLKLLSTHQTDTWIGTAQRLHTALAPLASAWPRGKFPKNARALGAILRAESVMFVKMGYLHISYQRYGKKRTRLITIHKQEGFRSASPDFISF